MLPRPFAALALLALAACATPAPPARISGAVGRPLELALPDLDGRVLDVGAQQGKVRIVDLWATWCVPCRQGMPALEALQRELGPRGLAVVGVAFDEDRAAIPPFLAEAGVTFPVLWDRGGEGTSGRFDVQRLPTTLLVDRRGIVRFVHEGWTPAIAGREREQLLALLAEP